MLDARWSVPYRLKSGHQLAALVWAFDAADALYRAEVCLRRGGYPMDGIVWGTPCIAQDRSFESARLPIVTKE